mmetsp:Transcript_15732/g.45350  ORF Transcript_15732/g.45350 Transcript_15732/m.45350 type:complete len:219 (+) Transcript_15732:53-709(+)
MAHNNNVTSTSRDDNRLAPFNPTHESSIDVAIDLLQLQSADILFDLGCGDGRMIIRAASRVDGLRCVGIELDESLVARGRDMAIAISSAHKAALADRIEIRNGDVLADLNRLGQPAPATEDISGEQRSNHKLALLDDATAVFVYLLPQGLKKVKLLLEEAAKRRRREQTNGAGIGAVDNEMKQPALKVASYMFSIPGWNPVQVDRSGKGSCPIYLYHL